MINNYGFERLVCNHEITDLELYQWNDKLTIEQRDILWQLFRNEYIPSIIVPELDVDDNNKPTQKVISGMETLLYFLQKVLPTCHITKSNHSPSVQVYKLYTERDRVMVISNCLSSYHVILTTVQQIDQTI